MRKALRSRTRLLVLCITMIVIVGLLGWTFISAKPITQTQHLGTLGNPPDTKEHFTIEELKAIFDPLQTGDVIVVRGFSGLTDTAIPGYWTHSAIFDREKYLTQPYFLLSASADTDQGSMKVGYERIEKYKLENEIAVVRLKDATYEKARAAIDYGDQFLGRKFNFFATRKGDDQWYCSKVVYRAWLSQGINLEAKALPGDTHVTPTDLYNSPNVYEVIRVKSKI
jgi:hypothetical protein